MLSALRVELVVVNRVELRGSVSECAAVAPGAAAALPVHAHFRLSLGVVNSNTTTAATNSEAAASTAATHHLHLIHTLVVMVVSRWCRKGRGSPVGCLRVVINVVHLALGGVGHLPAWWESGLVACEVSSLLLHFTNGV